VARPNSLLLKPQPKTRSRTPKSDSVGKVSPSGTLFGRPCSLGVVARSSPSFRSARSLIAQRFWTIIPSLARLAYTCNAAALFDSRISSSGVEADARALRAASIVITGPYGEPHQKTTTWVLVKGSAAKKAHAMTIAALPIIV
jgi:hypothetical protein